MGECFSYLVETMVVKWKLDGLGKISLRGKYVYSSDY